MTDKADWFHSKEMAREMRKEGRILTAHGGYSTQQEMEEFLAGQKKRLKEQTASLKKIIKQAERDLAKM